MKAYTENLDQLAAQAITVSHFATSVVGTAGQALAGDVLAWMTANDFDVVPIESANTLSFVSRADLVTLNPDAAVKTAARAVPSGKVAAPGTPLVDALAILEKEEWFVVVDDGTVRGIVTRHDLGHPVVSLYLFALVISFERGLRRLLGTFSNTPIPDAPPEIQPSPDQPIYLSAVVNAAARIDRLREALGFVKTAPFRSVCGEIVALRDHLAHGRTILGMDSTAAEAVDRIRRLSELTRKVWLLAQERDQIWEAFAATQIVKRVVSESVWVGPKAVALPLPAPVHVITAQHPFERVLSSAENQMRNEALRRVLARRGVNFEVVEGRSPDGSWSEESFAVSGLSRAEACHLARVFGQRAVFEVDDEEMRVVDLDGSVRKRCPRSR
jgi:hypothetical protein